MIILILIINYILSILSYMFRILFLSVLLLGTIGTLASGMKNGKFSIRSTFLEAMWDRQTGAVDSDSVELAAVEAINNSRMDTGLSPLETDIGLRDWLRQEISAGNTDLKLILRNAREACPSYVGVAVFSTSRFTAQNLEAQVSKWHDGLDPTFSHAAAVVMPSLAGLELGCVVIAGERLARFSPEALAEKPASAYFSICTHCGSGHSCMIAKQSQCVTLECPKCHNIYAMLAADTHSHLRYVNEYLTGFQPRSYFPKTLSRRAEMFLIWRQVSQVCHYTPDPANPDPTTTDDPTDAWQTAEETQALQTGDCEDSSIMLTDWLISRGFEARVSVGRFAERGGHAWVVSRLEGREYLLESTNPNPDITHEPIVAEVGSRYVPEMQFDREAIYVRKSPQDRFDGDYWSTSKWIRVPARPHAKRLAPMATLDLGRVLSAWK